MTAAVVVGLPLLGALVALTLPAARSALVVAVLVAVESAWLVLGPGGSLTVLDATFTVDSVARVAMLAASLVVVSGLAMSSGKVACDYAVATLATLGCVALAVLVERDLVVASLALVAAGATLSVPLVRSPGAGASLRVAQRYVTWIVLAGFALALSAALGRLYLEQAVIGVLGPESALFVVGVAIFLQAAPFCLWLPSVSDEMPLGAAFATGLLGCATGAVVAGVTSSGLVLPTDPSLRGLLGAGAGAAAILSAFIALGEKRPGRALAFVIAAASDVALIGLAAGSVESLPGVVVLLEGQSLAASLALACLGVAGLGRPSRDRSESSTLAGFLWRRPAVGAALVVSLLSLAGMPLTAGFVGRLDVARLVASSPVESIELVAATVLAGLAILRSFGGIFELTDAKVDRIRPVDVVVGLAAVLIVVGGIYPDLLTSALK